MNLLGTHQVTKESPDWSALLNLRSAIQVVPQNIPLVLAITAGCLL